MTDNLVEAAGVAGRGGFFLFLGNALSTVLLAVGSIVIARLLGPTDYGLYTLVMLVPALFVSLADLGLNFALIRIPARLRSAGDFVASTRAIRLCVLMKLLLSVVVFLGCFFGAGFIASVLLNRPGLMFYVQIAGALIVFQAVSDAATNSFIGLDLMQYSAGIQVIYASLKSVLSPVLLLLGFGIVGAIVGNVLGFLVAGLFGAVLLFTRHVRRDGSGASHVGLGTVFGYSLPLYVAALFTVLLTQYQTVVLAHFASDVQIGNFNAAWNFNMLLSILIYPISTAIFPMFSKMSGEDRGLELRRGFVLAVKYASFILIPAAMGVMVFSRELIILTYGRSYVLAPEYLTLVAVVYLLAGIGLYVIGSFLNGVGATRTVLLVNVVTLGVYLPLGPVLTMLWGPVGLLVAYVISAAVSTLYGVRRVGKSFHVYPEFRTSVRLFLASLGAAVPVVVLFRFLLTGSGLVVLIAGGCFYLFLYLTLVPISGAVLLQDVKNLEDVLCRMRAVNIFAKPILAYMARVLSWMTGGRRGGFEVAGTARG